MEPPQRDFLEDLLATHTPSGFERPGQSRWIEYVESFADDVRTDDYGNAIAVYEGDDTEIAFGGHGDEIGFMVRDIEDDGTLRLRRVGGSDRTVSRGQHVRVHASDGPVSGVIGQTAIHLRDPEEEGLTDVAGQFVDIGASDAEEAAELVERGDPITFEQRVSELANGLLSARGMDNRVGTWAAADGLRRAIERDVDATVYAVSTIQEEVGLKGAQMVGFDLAPDAFIAVDVVHATDSPDAPAEKQNGVELSEGPVISRGSANHPAVVDAVRKAADDEEIDVQIRASGIRTGTDADAVFTSRGGVPSMYLGVPNRYMHTPVELIDPADLEETAAVLGAFASRAAETAFSVDF